MSGHKIKSFGQTMTTVIFRYSNHLLLILPFPKMLLRSISGQVIQEEV